MHDPPRILVADDVPTNVEIVRVRLEAHGYEIITASDGEEALARIRADRPDLVLLDVMMPKRDGLSVLKEIKADGALGFIPVILVTAKADTKDLVAGLEAGGDDYLTKPFEQASLVARVRAMLRNKALHDTVQSQAQMLADQQIQLADWNRTLESRVVAQMAELERMGRLQRFLSPQVAKLVAGGDGSGGLLESHRREVTVVFCDLRGFTAFTEAAEPEEVMQVLGQYHRVLGEIIFRYEGTLERFAGDGILTLFNDPIPCADHALRAVTMALEMRDRIGEITGEWRRRGHALGFGIGLAAGYATLGQIGFEGRYEYAAVGSVTNLASRLCDEAKADQIIASQRAYGLVEAEVEAAPLGELILKGFSRPVPAYDVLRKRENAGEAVSLSSHSGAGATGSGFAGPMTGSAESPESATTTRNMDSGLPRLAGAPE